MSKDRILYSLALQWQWERANVLLLGHVKQSTGVDLSLVCISRKRHLAFFLCCFCIFHRLSMYWSARIITKTQVQWRIQTTYFYNIYLLIYKM